MSKYLINNIYNMYKKLLLKNNKVYIFQILFNGLCTRENAIAFKEKQVKKAS